MAKRKASTKKKASGASRASGRSARGRASSRRTAGGSRGRARKPQDAIQLLKSDHREVQQLFDQFEKARAPKQQQLAEQICRMLAVHAQIEEEIFYPAAREALRDADLVDEAEVEHASAKDLIAQIEDAAGDDKFEARVKVLGEYVRHHVKEEESEMFKQLQGRKLDLQALGERLLQRKMELMGEAGGAMAGAAMDDNGGAAQGSRS